MARTVYRARYVFPVDGPPVEDGCVAVEGERIAAVGRGLTADETRDLGNTAILPGLVNAHTHLEFSDVPQPLGAPGMAMPDWIRQVIEYRRTAQRAPDAVERGIRESIRAGTTTLGEIAQPGWRSECLGDAPLDAVVFLELLALAPERVDAKLDEARQHLATSPVTGTETRKLAAGLSPHAPYTVHPELLRQAVALAQQHRAPLAFHLAESREELELLRSASGPFRELFDERGFWVERAIPRGTRPLEYLKQLSDAPRTLIVHGNYLDEEELDFLAAHADRMSLVYCPRTHAYFGHSEHPWRRLLARGVTVALGTDSRASNPDLSLLAELRFVAQRATVDPAVMLDMATLAGARALGLDHTSGSIRPGKLANLTLLPLPERSASDPHELIADSDLQPRATIWRGRLVLLSPGLE
jgi:cytosine/adenosine deaminase-related metal-dependent hydrolase